MIASEDIFALVNVDEVGIHTAHVGPFVLKSTFLPVYENEGDELRMAALVGGARFQLAGRAVDAAAVEQLPSQERERAVELGRVLVALNRGNTGVDGLDVIMPSGDGDEMKAGPLGAVLDAGYSQIACADFDPARLVCELPSADRTGLGSLARNAAECRRRNVGVALRGFAGTQAAIEAVRAIRPEIVAIDPRWFRQVAAMTQSARLLPPLFGSLRTMGAQVHVGGLDNPSLVSAAMTAGADLLSGSALAGPVLAGAFLKPMSILAEDFRRAADNIVPLFG
ncbi:MAG: EAL domain-containing protein [Rhizobiaceae bacterium]